MDIPEVDVNKADRGGRTPLLHSGSSGLFLKSRKVDVNLGDRMGRTVLHVLARRGKSLDVALSRPDIKANLVDADGESVLFTSCRMGNPDAVERLLR